MTGRSAAVGVLLAVLAVAGCSTPLPTPPTSGQTVTEPAPQPVLDSAAAVAALVRAGLAANPVPSDEVSDPNHLLGRPGNYTSRATFTVPGVAVPGTDAQDCGRGGCVEGWPDQASAKTRADYIANIGKSFPAAVEYQYVRRDGLLLRVARDATPTQAKKVGQAFLAL